MSTASSVRHCWPKTRFRVNWRNSRGTNRFTLLCRKTRKLEKQAKAHVWQLHSSSIYQADNKSVSRGWVRHLLAGRFCPHRPSRRFWHLYSWFSHFVPIPQTSSALFSSTLCVWQPLQRRRHRKRILNPRNATTMPSPAACFQVDR